MATENEVPRIIEQRLSSLPLEATASYRHRGPWPTYLDHTITIDFDVS